VKALAALLLLAPLAAGAQMYKCVDARGTVQYTDEARAGCKALDIRPSPPISGGAKPGAEDLAGEEAAFRRRQSEREASAEAERKAKAELERRCASLRKELAYMTSGRRVATYDANGERSYLDDAVRERRAAELREQLRACP